MLQVTKFYARSFDLDHMDLFWELGDTLEPIVRYEFTILRSESPLGPWEALTPPFQDQYYFRDVSPALLHSWRTLYYLLRVRDKVTNEIQDVGPTAQVPEPDLIALEIMRQEDALFREFVGRQVWLYPVRTFGTRCVCFDRVLGRRTKSNCLNCYDTSYLGGYLSPINCYVQFDTESDSSSNTPFGEHQTGSTTARLISFPPVKPKDIVIETENYRWRVESVGYTRRLRSIVRQELTLKEIPRGDVEYRLPVNLSITTLQPSAERNFTNPQHTDGDADLKNILAVYEHKPRGAS